MENIPLFISLLIKRIGKRMNEPLKKTTPRSRYVENIRKKILRHRDIMEKKPAVIIRIWFSNSSIQNNYLNYGHVSLETTSPYCYVSFYPQLADQGYPKGRFVDYAYDIKNGIPSEEHYQSIILYLPTLFIRLFDAQKNTKKNYFHVHLIKKIPILSRTTGLNLKDIIPITHLCQLKRLQIHIVD